MSGPSFFVFPSFVSEKEEEREMKRFEKWCKRIELKHRFEDKLVSFFESEKCLYSALILTLVIVLALGAMIIVAMAY